MESRHWRAFVASEKVLDIISMSTAYGEKPSELVDIQDKYTAYCFDEACLLIRKKLESGEAPTFKKQYKSFHDLYRQFG